VGQAWIAGSSVEIGAAVGEAARLLRASRHPLVAGLGTDVAGARAAVALARQLGGAIDHMHSDALLRDLDVMREAGMMVTTLNEARLRADTLLIVGGALAMQSNPARALLGRPTAPEIGAGTQRRIFWLCPGQSTLGTAPEAEIQRIGGDVDEVPSRLAALRARVAGRPIAGRVTGRSQLSAKALDALAADLKAARFGVVVWSAAEIDALTVEMLCGLVDDLNGHTRFSGLPLAPDDNAAGVLDACAWATGLPVRTGFGRAEPEHDPWRFDAVRLVESREADCAVWISAYGDVTPPWRGDLPTIALMGTGASLVRSAHVQIEVGRPGLDHDTIEHLAATATLVARAAPAPGDAMAVAQALRCIAAAMPPGDAGTPNDSDSNALKAGRQPC